MWSFSPFLSSNTWRDAFSCSEPKRSPLSTGSSHLGTGGGLLRKPQPLIVPGKHASENGRKKTVGRATMSVIENGQID